MPNLLVRRARCARRYLHPCFPDGGPLRLLIEIKRWDSQKGNYRALVPGWVVDCSDSSAMDHVRLALQQLMSELHNTTLTTADPPSGNLP